MFTFLIFRSQPVGDRGVLGVALDHLLAMSGLASDAFTLPPFVFWFLVPVLALDLLTLSGAGAWWSQRLHWAVRGAVTAGLALAGFVLGSGASQAFIYFRF